MTTNNEAGIPPAVEQAPPGTPPLAQEQSLQQTPPPNAEASAAPQPPADFQAQLDALSKRATDAENSARFHQSRADTEANRVRALAGLQPVNQAPADPLAPYLERYSAYEPTVAKTFAEIEYKNDQRFNQLQTAVHLSTQMEPLMDAAFAANPELFSDPVVNNRVKQTASQYAKDGVALTADHLAEMAVVAKFYVDRERAKNPAAPPPLQPQFSRGMFGVGNNFAGTPPVPQNGNAIPAHLKALQQETAAAVQARYKLPTSQQ